MSENGQQRFYPLRDDLQQITEQDPQQPSGVWATLGMLAGRVKAITGRSVWTDNPPTNLTEAKTHHDSKQNPHNVSRAQIGAAAQTDLDSHTAARDNPHAVSAAQAGAPPTSRTISTTAPLSGGGNLSANRTLSITPASTSAAGSMSASDKSKLDGLDAANYAPASHVGSGGVAHANAVAGGASGFMTGAEKSKLNSVNVIDTSYRCELTRDSDVSFANGSWATIPWNVETLDPRNWHDNVTNPTRITPGAAGTYLVQFYMAWRSGSGTRDHMVGMNGSHMAPRNRVDCAVNPNGTMSSVFIVNLTSATDYIELFAKQDSGGALNLFGTSNTVIVARIL